MESHCGWNKCCTDEARLEEREREREREARRERGLRHSQASGDQRRGRGELAAQHRQQPRTNQGLRTHTRSLRVLLITETAPTSQQPPAARSNRAQDKSSNSAIQFPFSIPFLEERKSISSHIPSHCILAQLHVQLHLTSLRTHSHRHLHRYSTALPLAN